MTEQRPQIHSSTPRSVDQRWPDVQRLFEAALQRDAAQRSAFLSDACNGDAELRAEVESLIEHDAQAEDTFLQPPSAPRRSAKFSEADEPDPLIGQRMGKYLIQRVIGAGGMGTVYEAIQDKPRRIVALKVVRPGFTSRKMLRRFEIESEILARLHHPNIAQVYEAGVHRLEGGAEVAFFAMEYVEGAQAITDFADREGLDTKARLSLFMQACDAVHHGHQKGVVHRDLKPANILVERPSSSPVRGNGRDGRVKIIDFGVAHSTDSDVAVTTMRTDVGQLIGTLQYMSPEQCDADSLEIDTRSDVYSLGVILFELLTGELPYDATRTTIYQATRIIKEHQPKRLSAIRPRLRGDVETIVLKALEKDRDKRYASASALAEDIGRFVRDEPIDARAPTLWTRYLRWVARHPVAGTAVLAMFIAIVIISVVPSIALWYGSRKPYDVRQSIDHRSASVISAAGTPLHTWQGDVPGAVTATGFVRHGGASLAIVGFHPYWPNDLAGRLCTFDAHGPYDKPIWCSELTDAQIPPTKRKGFSPKDFAPHVFKMLDVFPQADGPEIVVAFSNNYSWRMIRIYALDGRLLYQVWHDGVVAGLYWMREAKLLLVSGSNDECYWKDRGYEDIDARVPIVVFALRPRLGKISNELLDVYCRTGDDRPVWYRYVAPIRLNDVVRAGVFQRPSHRRFSAGDHVQINFPITDQSPAFFRCILDSNGRVVPENAMPGDPYNLLENPPDFSDFALRDFNELQRCRINRHTGETAAPATRPSANTDAQAE